MNIAARTTAPHPLPLRIACAVAALEGAVMVTLGVMELLDFSTARMALVLSSAAFFLLYGAGLLACAVGLWKLSSWARSPLVAAQLLQLGVAWNLRPEETRVFAWAIVAVSAAVLVGIFHPASVAAVAEGPDSD